MIRSSLKRQNVVHASDETGSAKALARAATAAVISREALPARIEHAIEHPTGVTSVHSTPSSTNQDIKPGTGRHRNGCTAQLAHESRQMWVRERTRSRGSALRAGWSL